MLGLQKNNDAIMLCERVPFKVESMDIKLHNCTLATDEDSHAVIHGRTKQHYTAHALMAY